MIEKLRASLDYFISWNPPFYLKNWKWIRLSTLVALDVVTVVVAWIAAFFLRFEDVKFGGYQTVFRSLIPYLIICSITSNYFNGLYRQVWRYATLHSAIIIFRSLTISTIATSFVAFMLEAKVPRSIFIIYLLLGSLITAMFRFFWRGWANFQAASHGSEKPACVIYGAGSGGDLLARHISANPNFPYRLVGFLDDDPNKKRRLIHGIEILGSGNDLAKVKEKLKIDTVILAIPSASGTIVRNLFAICDNLGIKALTMPDMADALGSDAFSPRTIDVKDLLRRAPEAIDKESIKGQIGGKVVLVTGAGGSIGSELCRQLVEFLPSKIVLLDSSELALYQIETEINDKNLPKVGIFPVLGSVTDRKLVIDVFEKLKPDVVFHAAAYKHVPLVEANVSQGILNNVLGTKIIAESAGKFKADSFLLISSDKAVNPTSVMGGTKRCSELIIQTCGDEFPNTRFSAVRFGNVLGSSGSVIPRFLNQIQKGGPITVTHPEVTRYFMLNNEAVGLVLQSASMAKGGEIFILDMGDPVNIAEMAKHLIKLSGKKIDIIFTGLRPGEKLYEELILEGVEDRTKHDNIFVARNATKHSRDPKMESIESLISFAANGNDLEAYSLLKNIVSN